MIIIYALIAIFIAWIWVDYYRLIDVFEPEKLTYLVITFLFGCASVLIVFLINDWFLDQFHFRLNGNILNDFLFSTFKIGAVEELAKTLAFLLALSFFRREFREPIDYLAYICTAALGFSAVENILYFESAGAHIIAGRSVLSTVGHMFDTALVGYGIILYKYHPRKFSIWIIPLFFLLASLAHGLYDFWILYSGFAGTGSFLLLVYFGYTLSFFVVILNNAINNSHLFTYKTTVDPRLVSSRLLTYYIIVFALEFILVGLMQGFLPALAAFNASLFTAGFVAYITSVRMSRFRLIHDHWHPLRFELPVEFIPVSGLFGVSVRIRGESHNEAVLSQHFEEQVVLKPLSKRKSYLGRPVNAFIADKIFMKNEHPFFPVFLEEESPEQAIHVIIPKTYGKTMHGKYPIVSLAKSSSPVNYQNFEQDGTEFKFLEWVYIKHQT